MTGYVCLHRKIFDNALFRANPDARHLFMDLLALVAWRETDMDWRGNPVRIKRGQVMISTRALVELTGFSHQKVRTILANLTAHQIAKIDTADNTRPCVITLCNFDVYQGDQHSANTESNTAPTRPQHIKEEEEEKEEKNNNTPLPPTGEEPEPAKFARDQSSGLAVTRAYEAYCQAAIRSNTPLPIGLSPELRRSIGARLKASGQEAWDTAIANMEASDFLRGLKGDGSFVCNIHWFAKPANFAKVLSGCYANRQGKPTEKFVDMAALLAERRAKREAANAQRV